MGLFGISWGTIATGAAVATSFVGGPVLGGIVGAAAGAIQAAADGKGWEQITESALVGGALGAIPGGLVGGATKGLFEGGGKALAASFKDVPDLLSKSSNLGGFASRLGFARANMARPVLGAVTAGVSTAAGLAGWDKLQDKVHASAPAPKQEKPKKDLPDQLPTRIISSSTGDSDNTPEPRTSAA
ncbi:hypothetical protein ACW2Q0_03780 [Nocardia sp. R16R-3T]